MLEQALSWEAPDVNTLQQIISRSNPRIARGVISKEPDKVDSITAPMSKAEAQKIKRKLSKRQAGSESRRFAIFEYLREVSGEEHTMTGMQIHQSGKFADTELYKNRDHSVVVKILNNDLRALLADGFLLYEGTVNSNNQPVRGYWAK
tara:strand:+ start:399 stop:842 length:444 start_codon:yes stop_codon:yes gene_type:complete